MVDLHNVAPCDERKRAIEKIEALLKEQATGWMSERAVVIQTRTILNVLRARLNLIRLRKHNYLHHGLCRNSECDGTQCWREKTPEKTAEVSVACADCGKYCTFPTRERAVFWMREHRRFSPTCHPRIDD